MRPKIDGVRSSITYSKYKHAYPYLKLVRVYGVWQIAMGAPVFVMLVLLIGTGGKRAILRFCTHDSKYAGSVPDYTPATYRQGVAE